MTRLDRIILAVIAAGLWALFLQNTGGPTQAEDQRSKRSIEVIIEDCRVTGQVYLYSDQYGEIERGKIRC